MKGNNDRARRAYNAPRREAAAARTRDTIIRGAGSLFAERGWAATTIRDVAEHAEVSPKTIEALFGTKAALLHAAVDYAIRGDTDPVPMPQRTAIARMERAASAAAMLDLHATHLRRVNERSADIAWVVEQAAHDDTAVASLWTKMNDGRTFAVEWATTTLLAKPGRRRGLRRRDAEAAFWVALDWSTYRTLTRQARLSGAEFETWVRRYYRLTLLQH